MYAEVDSWCVTVRAVDRNADLESLKILSKWLIEHNISFGQSGVVPLKWVEKDEDPVPEPFVWIPYHNGQEVQMFMNQAGIESSFVTFEDVDFEPQSDSQPVSDSATNGNSSLLGILFAER